MCGMLDFYLQAFSKLRADLNRTSWTPSTNYRSPYKPFLLLSVLDLVGVGSINKNFIDPSFELTETFQGYIALLPPMNRQASMAYPFFYLQSSGFWHLQPRSDADIKPGQTISTIKRLRECYYGAKVNDDLYPLLQMQTSREKLRAMLIESYFAPEIQQLLWEQSVLNYDAANYSANLLVTAEPPPPPESAEPLSIPHPGKDTQERWSFLRIPGRFTASFITINCCRRARFAMRSFLFRLCTKIMIRTEKMIVSINPEMVSSELKSIYDFN